MELRPDDPAAAKGDEPRLARVDLRAARAAAPAVANDADQRAGAHIVQLDELQGEVVEVLEETSEKPEYRIPAEILAGLGRLGVLDQNCVLVVVGNGGVESALVEGLDHLPEPVGRAGRAIDRSEADDFAVVAEHPFHPVVLLRLRPARPTDRELVDANQDPVILIHELPRFDPEVLERSEEIAHEASHGLSTPHAVRFGELVERHELNIVGEQVATGAEVPLSPGPVDLPQRRDPLAVHCDGTVASLPSRVRARLPAGRHLRGLKNCVLEYYSVRQAILDAALAEFAEKGMGSATVEGVRRRSGASVGSIYHWFDGKEAIVSALYVEGVRDYQRGLLDTLRRNTDAERGIKSLVRHHLRWVERNPDLARFLLATRETDGQELRELNREVFSATANWLQPHVKAGRVRRLPLDLYYMLLIGPSQEFARHWLQDLMRSSIRTAERALAQAAWDALRTQGED
jgi:AcrR family transcriptional regulator